MGYLSHRALVGLKHYKYKPAGYTILDVWHTPAWNFCVELLPMWLAPNMVTLTGLMFVFAAYIINTIYMLDYYGPAPPWIHLFSCFAVCIYVNLDCLDGKQARRTRSSSPLGQLFDHGCDALSVNLLLQNVHCSLDYHCDYLGEFTIMMITIPWVLAHWEEYHTGVLQYGNGFFGVLEANYALAAVHIATYLLGQDFWATPMNWMIPVTLETTIEARHIFMLASIIGGFIQIHGQVTRVFPFKPEELPEDERGSKELGSAARWMHLAYVMAMSLLGLWWTSDSDVVSGQCRASTMAYTFIYSLISSQLIISHMAKEPVTPSLWGYALLLVGAANRQFRWLDTYVMSCALVAIAAIGYAHYVLSVVQEIAIFLGIGVLTIKKIEAEKGS